MVYVALKVTGEPPQPIPDSILHDMAVLRNEANDIRDDFVQLGSATYDTEIAYNIIRGAWPSHEGIRDQPAGHEATKYIHHNVIDTSDLVLWSRFDPLGLITNAAERGWNSPIPMSTHTHDNGCPLGDPWKIYNNTFILGNKNSTGSVGAHLYAPSGNNLTGQRHEVYNNIFYETANNPYFPDSRTSFMRKWKVLQPFEFYDANLYRRAPGGTITPIFFEVVGSGPPPNFTTNYLTLADFIGSVDFDSTVTSERDGWESHGLEMDPQFIDLTHDNYHVTRTSPAANAAIDLSTTGWPGTTPAPWLGALAVLGEPTDHLVGYWSFDEGRGGVAHDFTYSEHDGALFNGTDWQPGRIGTGLHFDDVDDYVSIANQADLNFGADTNFSITGWIRVDTPLNLGNILMKGRTGTFGRRYLVQATAAGRLLVNLDDDIRDVSLLSSGRIDDGAWHFFATTADRNGYLTLYIDGSASWRRTNIAPLESIDDSEPLKLGGTTHYFHGSIDELRIYRDRILTPNEVDAIFADGN